MLDVPAVVAEQTILRLMRQRCQLAGKKVLHRPIAVPMQREDMAELFDVRHTKKPARSPHTARIRAFVDNDNALPAQLPEEGLHHTDRAASDNQSVIWRVGAWGHVNLRRVKITCFFFTYR